MNYKILFKSMKIAFRAKRRVFSFIIIYAILFISVAYGLKQAVTSPGSEVPYLVMAFCVATIYAILISQFRRKDIAILKCVSWSNSEVMLLLIGEVILVALSAILIVFQVSVEILGLVAYFEDIGSVLFTDLKLLISVDAQSMIITIFYIVILQIPGLFIAQYRAMKIPPMKALREE